MQFTLTLSIAGVAQNSFLTLCELASTKGDDIAKQLIISLNELGFTLEILKSRLLAWCTDGASNLQGHMRGALAIFSKELERTDIIVFHCMNHKLELAVHDAVKITNKVSHLRMFMDSLYAHYSRSPRNCRLLHVASNSLGVQFRKIGKVFDVRWLSSSYNAVNALYQSVSALTMQLEEAADDVTSLSKDRAKCSGMVKKLRSWSFLAEVILVRDVLIPLRDMSLFLQRRSASILDAKGIVETTINTLTSLKTVDGLSLADFHDQIAADGKFDGIEVTRSNNDEAAFLTMRVQFIQALIDNLSARFPNRQLLEVGSVLSPSSWPDNEVERVLFGDRELIRIAQLCNVDCSKALDQFRQYKNNVKVIGTELATLLQRVHIIPVSSSECERGFSCMNLNDTDVRNRLSVQTLSSLIFIKVNGPHPSHFEPTTYVVEWLKAGRHASSDHSNRQLKSDKRPSSLMSSLYC